MTKQERCPIHKPGWYSECSTCNPDTQGQPEQTTSEREREIRELAQDDHQHDFSVHTVRFLLTQLDEARLKLRNLHGLLHEDFADPGMEIYGLVDGKELRHGGQLLNKYMAEAERVLKEGK